MRQFNDFKKGFTKNELSKLTSLVNYINYQFSYLAHQTEYSTEEDSRETQTGKSRKKRIFIKFIPKVKLSFLGVPTRFAGNPLSKPLTRLDME